MGDEIARLQHRFALGGFSRQEMEVSDWDGSVPRSPFNVNHGLERREGNVHI